MTNIVPYFVLLLSVKSFAEIQVQYLQGNSRGDASPIKDYYFSCSAVGQTLQWSVNRLGLGGFSTGSRAGDLLTSSRSNFAYSSTLVSKGALADSQGEFTSVLLVTVQNELHLEVACRTESKQNITSNNAGLTDEYTVERFDHTIYLQYVLSYNIMSDNRYTSIFLCEVRGSRMMWQASDEYSFQPQDVIGTSRQEIVSEDGHNIIKEQAILIAQEPFPFVSLLVVTEYSGNVIVCGSDDNTVRIPILSVIHQTPPTSNDSLTLGSTTPITSTLSSTQISSVIGKYLKHLTQFAELGLWIIYIL